MTDGDCATPAQQPMRPPHIEAEIDALVADLYGLDDDEKKLVGIG